MMTYPPINPPEPTHTDYLYMECKSELEDAESEISALQETIEELEIEKKNLINKVVEKVRRISELSEDNSKLHRELITANRNNQKLRDLNHDLKLDNNEIYIRLDAQNASVERFKKTIADLKNEVQLLRTHFPDAALQAKKTYENQN